MASVRRRRSFRQGSGQKRPAFWSRHHAQGSAAANANVVNNLMADYEALRGITAIDPGTTVSGGWISLTVQATTVTPLTAKVAVGIIVVDENTAAQVPNAAVDAHVDWMFYATGYLITDGSPTAKFTLMNQQFRSRRRMDEVGMNCYCSIVSQAAMDYQLDTSLLLKLR
jgi:hypothetical protein